MSKLLVAAIFAAQLTIGVVPEHNDPTEDFSVEPLQADEIKQVTDTWNELEAARGKYESTLNKVRSAHGQTYLGGWAACGGIRATVEIRGKYALISRTKDYNSCPVAASATRP